jgi:hypothetical protein
MLSIRAVSQGRSSVLVTCRVWEATGIFRRIGTVLAKRLRERSAYPTGAFRRSFSSMTSLSTSSGAPLQIDT